MDNWLTTIKGNEMHPLLYKLKRLYRKEKLPDPFGFLYKWFRKIPEGVFQVGASAGQEIKGFTTQGIKYGVFVEPLPDAFAKLRDATGAKPGYIPINAVCLETPGIRCDFHVSADGGAASSALKPTQFLGRLHPEVQFDSHTLSLTSTTVDQIVADLNANGRADVLSHIDLLYLDTQGAELRVLQGAENFLKQVRYIFTEVSRGGLYENDVRHADLTEYLEQRGFSLVFLYLVNGYWGDALYVHDSLLEREER